MRVSTNTRVLILGKGARSLLPASLAALTLCLPATSRAQAPAADTTRTTGSLAAETLRHSSPYLYPPQLGPGDRIYWTVAGSSLMASVFLDRTAGPAIREYRTVFLDRVAPLGDVFGTANYTVPTITATLIVAHLAHNANWEDATRHITLSYIVGDVSEALLKGAVGRQRPSYSGDPWRFRPLSFSNEWHSFPSGHVSHITAIAAAFAEEVHRPWATALSTTAVVFTGWQRIYRNQHWASDVVGGMIVGIAASRVTAHWLRHHRHAR